MKMRVLLVLAMALMIPAAALAEAPQHTFRGNLVYVSPTGDETIFDTKVEADSALGFGLAYEYRFTDLYGLEGQLTYSSHDVQIGGETAGDTSVMPLTLALNFHLSKNDKVDFYVGPVIGYVFYDDLSLDDDWGGEDVKLKNGFAWGVQAGIDVPFNENWAFTAGLTYLQTTAETDEEWGPATAVESDRDLELDVNPWVLRAGIALKF